MIIKILNKLDYSYRLIGFLKKRFSSNPSRKIIIMVDGGLGSQINKYFLGRFLEKARGVSVEYDITWFKRCGKSLDGNDTRNFDLLEIFPSLHFPIASELDAQGLKKYFAYKNHKPFEYNNKIVTKKLPLYIDGYYSHFRYIVEADAVKDFKFNESLFSANSEKLKTISKEKHSVSVHVRRGDYVGSPHDVLTVNYFIHAILFMHEQLKGVKPSFFIFSNDMRWVEKNILSVLPDEIKFEMIEGNDNSNAGSDMFLMSQCRSHICSNSSFSYYAAYLSKNSDKMVVIPEKWMKSQRRFSGADKAFRIPGWIVMSNEGVVL